MLTKRYGLKINTDANEKKRMFGKKMLTPTISRIDKWMRKKNNADADEKMLMLTITFRMLTIRCRC